MISQPRLIPPPVEPLARARDAVRRARERALTAKASPAAPPEWWSPSVSVPASTVEDVPRGRVAGDPPPHGTRARYNHRPTPCRCVKCRTANNRYMAHYRGRVRIEAEAQADQLTPAR